MRNPEQFVTLQRVLASNDALNEYIQHIASGVFVSPPGLGGGGRTGAASSSADQGVRGGCRGRMRGAFGCLRTGFG